MIPDLRDIWAQDRNGDGIVDYLNARIYLPEVPTPAELAAAGNVAARLAFETTSLDLPLAFPVSDFVPNEAVSIFVGRAATGRKADARTIVLENPADAEAFSRLAGRDRYAFQPADNRSHAADVLRTRTKRLSLASLFTGEFLYADHDSDHTPEAVDTVIVIGPDVHSLAVVDLAARIALEPAGLRLPLVLVSSETQQQLAPYTILIGRTEPHVQALIRAGKLEPVEGKGTGRIEIVDDFVVVHGENAAAEEEALRYLSACLPGLRGYGKNRASLLTIEDQARRHTKSKPPEPKLIFSDEFACGWEVDDVREQISLQVVPHLREGSTVQLDVRVSEPLEVRNELTAELLNLLKARGVDMTRTSVRVLSAHKQGFSWIQDSLIPQMKGIASVRVAWRELEAGSGSVDSRTRWLEELYPIDEILARELGIPAEQITFHSLPPDAPQTYEVIAENTLGEILLRSSFDPRTVPRPLFDLFPEYATATVATGGIRAMVDEELVLETRVASDYERFWDAYQSRILPRIRDYVLNLHGGVPNPSCSPHFDALRLDVEMSEPDANLAIDQERISTVEALHEDLYFETLLFFDVLGTRTCGRPLRYPGRIIPIVKSVPGKGVRARVRFTGYDSPMPEHTFNGLDPLVTGLDVQTGRGLVSVEVTAGQARFCWLLQHVDEPPAMKPEECEAPIVPLDRPISPIHCEHLIRRLAGFPEVRPFQAGVSFLGQPVWAMDVTSSVKGKYISQVRTRLSKPCLFLTGRQHANEVSSTSHILKFVELLVSSADYRSLLQKVNFVVHPIANPDGAALVDELYPQMPHFMLHAGYLGALGVDITEDQWSICPRYPEARVRADLWRMWLPDIVLNPHGYPSHEWVQLFAGYTAWVRSRNVTARDWWIPRGWFMPRFDFVEDERLPGHALAALLLRDGIAEAVNRTLGSVNTRMYHRYAKYRGEQLRLHDGVLINTPAKGVRPDPNSFSFMTRHPEVTFFEGLSEAPDEIATGEWLEMLAAAGLEVTLVHARFLAELPRELKRVWWEKDGKFHLAVSKQRQVQLANMS